MRPSTDNERPVTRRLPGGHFGNGRLVAAWLLACTILFIIAMGIAMAGYPGGHGWSSDAAGYDFWRNFWCDLLVPVTRTGNRDNRFSMLFAMLGMLAFATASVPLWLCFNRLIPGSPRLATAIRAAGLVSIAGILPIALTAGHAVPHALSILLTALSGWTAALLAVYALARHDAGGTVTRLGGAMLLLSAVNFLLYVRERFMDGSMWVALPASQKLATLAMVLWLLNIAWLFLQTGPDRDGNTRRN